MNAWYCTSLDIEEVITGIVDDDSHLFVADVVKSFDTVDRKILDCVISSLGLLAWFRHVTTLSIMLMSPFGVNLLPVLVNPGLEMVVSPKVAQG